MTHRPIAPIEINGFEPGGTPRALPIFEWVDPATLLVDDGYQRDSSERSLRLVRKIVSGWDWARYKPPVAVLTEAGLELIDGQHTAIAAATHPEVEQIPVMIVDVKERAERAGAFIGHNKDRVAVTAMQLHLAAVAAGDDAAVAVERVRAAAGVTFVPAIPKEVRPGDTMAVAAIAGVIKARGEERAIMLLKAAVEGGCAPITQVHIKAVDLLMNDPEYADLSPAKLPAVIRDMGPKAEAEAKIFVAAHPSVSLYKAVAIQWFKNRRGAKAIDKGPDVPASPRPSAVNQIGSRTCRPGSPVSGRPSASPQIGKRDSRPKLSGWAPGPVLLRCSGCDDKYLGDIRSKSCADCAYGCREVVSA